MTASLSDLLTAAKNIAAAINNASRTYLSIQGIQLAYGVTAPTVICTGTGRIASIAIDAKGSAQGAVYDASVIGDHSQPLCLIQSADGIQVINMPFNRGLLIEPGAGMKVTVSYTIDPAVGVAS